MTLATQQAGVVAGLRRRDAAQKIIEDHRPKLSTAARRVMVRRALEVGWCSVDDCHEQMEMPPGINLGACFRPLVRAGILEPVRPIPSRRVQAHARPVLMLKLASRELAQAWLDDNPEPPGPTKKPAVQRALPGWSV